MPLLVDFLALRYLCKHWHRPGTCILSHHAHHVSQTCYTKTSRKRAMKSTLHADHNRLGALPWTHTYPHSGGDSHRSTTLSAAIAERCAQDPFINLLAIESSSSLCTQCEHTNTVDAVTSTSYFSTASGSSSLVGYCGKHTALLVLA